jgi:hypothetical protein
MMNVSAFYGWKGNLLGYTLDGMSVPIADGNRHYQMIKEAIQTGNCTIHEPVISEVVKIYNRRGNLSGYKWSGLFIPIDERNKLYVLITAAINNGTCKVNEPNIELLDKEYKRIEKLVILIFFNRPWDHVSDIYEGIMPYPLSDKHDKNRYCFKLINIRSNNNPLDLLFESYQIQTNMPLTHFTMGCSFLEVEVPIKRLRNLFRNEKKIAEWLADLFEMHLLESDRSKKEGPDIMWLIVFAKTYLQNFIIDIGNAITEAFSREYGTIPIGFIDERKIFEDVIILNKYENGSYDLGVFNLSGKQDFNLSGKWNGGVGLQQIANQEQYPVHPQENALRRIRLLLKQGLHMEALCLLNAFLEVNICSVLCSFINNDSEKIKIINKIGHRARIKLFKEIVKSFNNSNIIIDNNYIKTIINVYKIYKYRNNYVHELLMPNNEHYLSSKTKNELFEIMFSFTDPWESKMWLKKQWELLLNNNLKVIGIIELYTIKYNK